MLSEFCGWSTKSSGERRHDALRTMRGLMRWMQIGQGTEQNFENADHHSKCQSRRNGTEKVTQTEYIFERLVYDNVLPATILGNALLRHPHNG